MIERKTQFSPCRKYRYTLWREWGNDARQLWNGDNALTMNPPGSFVQFIGLNPSTADETKDDPTIRRCIAYAKAWGFSGMCMTNLFAFRATDPEVMKKEIYPIGESVLNDVHLLEVGQNAGLIVAAWGNHGDHLKRGDSVRKWLRDTHGLKLNCFRLTKQGQPEHPLYQRSDAQLKEWI
jgi:hypothetical protein